MSSRISLNDTECNALSVSEASSPDISAAEPPLLSSSSSKPSLFSPIPAAPGPLSTTVVERHPNSASHHDKHLLQLWSQQPQLTTSSGMCILVIIVFMISGGTGEPAIIPGRKRKRPWKSAIYSQQWCLKWLCTPKFNADKTCGIHWFLNQSKYFLNLFLQVLVVLEAKAAARPIWISRQENKLCNTNLVQPVVLHKWKDSEQKETVL